MKKFIDFVTNNKVFRIIYNIIKTCICTVLAIYIAFVLYQRFTGNAPLFGYRVFTVATGSMVPVYEVNDVILVKEIDAKKLKIGDDIAYKGERGGFEGLIITHRIINIEEEANGSLRLFTKGVNNEYEDPSITDNQILGKVEGKVFFINALNHVIKSTWGFFVFIFLPLTLVIILEVLETIFEGKIERNEIRKIGSYDKEESDIMKSESIVVDKVLDNGKDEEKPSIEVEEKDEEII